MAVLAGAFVLALGVPVTAQEAPKAAGQAAVEQVASTGPANAADDEVTPGDGTTPLIPEYHGDSIAAIVNDTPISQFDLRQRVALFVATSGVKPSEKQMKNIREEVLKQLETERIQLLEAQKHNITVSAGEVDKAIDNIISDNGLSMDKLKQVLQQAGVYMSTLRGQIAAQIAWSKTVEGRYGDDVHVTPADVNSELRRLSESADKPRFHVSEIFLSVDTPEDADKVEKSMKDMLEQIRMGAPFAAVARQFSQNPTAAQGGDLGWVSPGQLQPELDKVLVNMRPGTVSDPIRAAGGFYVLALREREEPAGTKLPEQTAPKYPPGELPLARVLLPIGPTPPKDLAMRAMQAAALLRANIQNCQTLPEIVKHMPGAVYMDLGTMKLTNLSAQMQAEIAKTTAGETTEPFPSPAGIELIVRCDEAPPKITTFKMPTRNEIQQQLYEEQMSVLARRYMRDLRRDADIETR
jgi:peptidyl-prolyl cis-trans isomerase SurA